ncbi:MAG: hypothetical protein IJS99_08150 [Synergistaceae bacterium]|nr:hypothetical protein [Synergistaceae bacterium]
MRKIFIAVLIMITCESSQAFTPEQPIMKLNQVRPGMTGRALTVLRGITPEKIPVKIISIIPKTPNHNEILIKFLGGYKLAKGMSGSPVYIRGRIAGAVRSGWEDSDQTLAAVTPIEEMCAILDDNLNHDKNFLAGDLILSGMSKNFLLEKFADSLGLNLTQGISRASHNINIDNSRLKPGDSVSVLLAWGDVDLSASGTITATSKTGEFIAFGHSFLKRGGANYPAAKTFIHETVNSSSFPFKLTTPLSINGTITHDKESGIAGRFNYFGHSIGCELVFNNLDTGESSNYKFRVIADEFLTPSLLNGLFTGLTEEAWGRKGQGTMLINLRIDSKNVNNGWTRQDIFFSGENVLAKAFEQPVKIIDAFMTQPFINIMPAGFRITVNATQYPRALIIEDVDAPKSARPGDDVAILVTLREWRKDTFRRKFILRIPESASGVCEVVVRGGNTQPMSQLAVESGYKSINSLARMLDELKAIDSNNELFIELNTDKLGESLRSALSGKNNSDFLPEEQEYLSETKSRRIKEGTLKILSSEYFIDGMMKRIIHIDK